MNPRQKKVVKLVAEGKSQTQAYKEAYNTDNSNVAAVEASKLLRKPNVQNALQTALRAKGLDENAIADTLVEMKNNRDWRAKESAIDRIAKFHAYDQGPQSLTQINVGGDMGIQFNKDVISETT